VRLRDILFGKDEDEQHVLDVLGDIEVIGILDEEDFEESDFEEPEFVEEEPRRKFLGLF
jgi:hypothetical protein